jgi:hypothetical protein
MITVRRSVAFLSAILVSALASVGCSSSSGDDTGVDEGHLTPDNPATVFDQAETCNVLFEDKKAFRDPDLADGLLRWKCGDVKGVTINRDKTGKLVVNPDSGKISDLGQEYCEYHAIANGQIVDFAEDLKKLSPGAKLSCVFSGVYFDVGGTNAKSDARAKQIAVGVAQSLGSPTVDLKAVKMQDSVNSRDAASQLINDCQAAAAKPNLDADRQAACIQLALKGGTVDNSIAALCRGIDLSNDANWQKVVAKGGKVLKQGDADAATYERQRDVAACAATFPLASKGQLVPWRNSDPTICSRSLRVVQECGDKFPTMAQGGAIPPSVEGFTMTGWESHKLPDGCRRAMVDGKESDQVVICDVNPQKVKEAQDNIDVAPVDPQTDFCHDLFANNIAMQAPLRAVTTSKGTSTTNFCKAYNGTP